MKTFTALIFAGALVAGCANDATTDTTDEAAADLSGGHGLGLVGSWNIAPIPNGMTVDDYAVSRQLADTRPASIFIAMRAMAFPHSASTKLVIARSDDGAKSFKPIAQLNDVPALAKIYVAPSDDRIIYVTAGGLSAGSSFDAPGKLWRSVDGGKTFANPTTLTNVAVSLDIDPNDPLHLVGATCSGVGRSMDGGQTWQKIAGSPNLTGRCNYAQLYRAPSDRNVMYTVYDIGAGGVSLIARTTNGAGTWEEINSAQGLGSFAIHPRDAMHVYSFDQGRGFASSEDGGKTWFGHNSSLGFSHPGSFWDSEVSNVAFDTFSGEPGHEPFLYVINNGAVKRWAPSAGPEGGMFVRALPDAPQQLDRLRFELLSESLLDGSPYPALIGLTRPGDPDLGRRLAIAHLTVR